MPNLMMSSRMKASFKEAGPIPRSAERVYMSMANITSSDGAVP